VYRLILIAILILAAARFFWKLIEVVIRGSIGPAAENSGRGKRAPVKMQPCPVCGTFVVPGKAISIVSAGAPVYFCSDKCRGEYQLR
jgi:hypothetical protein